MEDQAHTLKMSVRARRMWATVYRDGRVIITIPRGIGQTLVDRFVRSQTTWIESIQSRFRKQADHVYLPRGSREYLRYKEKARVLVHECLVKYNRIYGFIYGRVSIKNLRCNWGSCSEKKNLNFNYKIVLLPRPLAEYVVVHELCHLGAFNHSRLFWALVARTIPDHETLRKELYTYHL